MARYIYSANTGHIYNEIWVRDQELLTVFFSIITLSGRTEQDGNMIIFHSIAITDRDKAS